MFKKLKKFFARKKDVVVKIKTTIGFDFPKEYTWRFEKDYKLNGKQKFPYYLFALWKNGELIKTIITQARTTTDIEKQIAFLVVSIKMGVSK